MDIHYYEFSGQATCLLLTSRKRNKFTKFHFFKRKPSGIWENPEKDEGSKIRITLNDVIKLLNLLEKEEGQSKIADLEIAWEENDLEEEKTFWFQAKTYSKMLNYCQALFLKYLLRHIVEEKVEFTTRKPESVEKKKDIEIIRGIIEKETENAILINLGKDNIHWIPKAKIHNKYDVATTEVQKFSVDIWLLKKEMIIH